MYTKLTIFCENLRTLFVGWFLRLSPTVGVRQLLKHHLVDLTRIYEKLLRPRDSKKNQLIHIKSKISLFRPLFVRSQCRNIPVPTSLEPQSYLINISVAHFAHRHDIHFFVSLDFKIYTHTTQPLTLTKLVSHNEQVGEN